MEPARPGVRVVHMTPDPACPEADQMLSDICRRVLRLQSHCLSATHPETGRARGPGPPAPRSSRGFGVELAEEADEFGSAHIHCAVDTSSQYYQAGGFATDEGSRREMNATVQHYLYKLGQVEKKPNKYHERIRNWISKWIPGAKAKGCSCGQKEGVPGNVLVSEAPATGGGMNNRILVDVHLDPQPKSAIPTSLHRGVSVLSRTSSDRIQATDNTITSRQSNVNDSQQRYQVPTGGTEENEIADIQVVVTQVVPANERERTSSQASRHVTLRPAQEEGGQTSVSPHSNINETQQREQASSESTHSNESHHSQPVITEIVPDIEPESIDSRSSRRISLKPSQEESMPTTTSRQSNLNDSKQQGDQVAAEETTVTNESRNSQVVITEIVPANEPHSTYESPSNQVVITDVVPANEPESPTSRSSREFSFQPLQENDGQPIIEEVADDEDGNVTHDERRSNDQQ